MKQLLLSSALLIATGTAANAMSISNLDDENTTIRFWGTTATDFYGQSFTLDTDASLDSVLFRINDFGTEIGFSMHVYAWDGEAASGSNLASANSFTNGSSGIQDVSVSTGGIDLTAGQWVVGFDVTSGGSEARWGGVDDASGGYDGGEFVFVRETIEDELVDSLFETFGVEDAAFSFEFSGDFPEDPSSEDPLPSVPLPAGGVLLLSGLAGVSGLKRRKNQAA